MPDSVSESFDLLDPREALLDQYRNQIRHTIDAYSPGHIVIAEAIQNALDAIAKQNTGNGFIDIHIDYDTSTVTVSDNGVGFPNEPRLLILGGSDKKKSSRTTAGMVGVGIKVVLYCSSHFEIRSNTGSETWCVEVKDAFKYADDASLKLPIPMPFQKDLAPREEQGTTVRYKFPHSNDSSSWRLRQFSDHIRSRLVDPQIGEEKGFVETLAKSKSKTVVADLFSFYLRRFTYAGDTLGPLGGRDGLTGTRVKLTITSSNTAEQMGEFWAGHWGDNKNETCEFEPSYLSVGETVNLTTVKRPGIYDENLGNGGQNLDRTASGFNVTNYSSNDDFKKLLKNKKGDLPGNLENYEKKLFGVLNCVEVTIGRIPQFNDYLPHGSRRVLSANGVVTEHDIAITSGRNQQYVRCLDIVVDLDAQLNYGKTHIVNGHLVALAREFVNDAYLRTLQTAAARFVGKIAEDDDDEQEDVFWARADLSKITSVPIQKVPRDENDVIALFVSLLTANHINDYLIYGLSQQDRYDARMVIRRDCDATDLLENHVESDLRIVEFKCVATSIVKDFESDIKDPKELHLVIAWDAGTISGTRFSIENIVHSKAYASSPQKVFPGAGHYIHDNKTGRELQLVLLKPYIESIVSGDDEESTD